MTKLPFPDMEPIIIEPSTTRRTANPEHGEYLLYDEDFPEERDPKFAVDPPDPALRRPHFSTGEVAAWAFGGKDEWLRFRLKGKPYRPKGKKEVVTSPLTLQGKPLTFRTLQTRRNTVVVRRFTLPDIERLAWALYEHHDIDGYELQRIMQILLAVTEQYNPSTTEER